MRRPDRNKRSAYRGECVFIGNCAYLSQGGFLNIRHSSTRVSRRVRDIAQISVGSIASQFSFGNKIYKEVEKWQRSN